MISDKICNVAYPIISIALGTFNGEKYLESQLESFISQTLHPYELVVCDDASTDSTLQILNEFSMKAPFPVRIFRNERNIGVIQNFSRALSLCTGEYIALSDQDDIWLPDKLEASYSRIRQAEGNLGVDIPLLIHSDLRLIDTEGNEIAPSFLKFQMLKHKEIDSLKTILARNFVTGCTCLCNRILVNESLPIPENVFMHDWWMALIAASRGHILFIPEAKVLYRQHSSNVLGAKHPYYHNIKGLLKRSNPPKAITTLLKLYYSAKELRDRLNELSCEVPSFLDKYIHALQIGGIINAYIVLCSIKVRTQGIIPNLLFFYRIARGQHIKYLNTTIHP